MRHFLLTALCASGILALSGAIAPATAASRYCLQGSGWGYPGNCQFATYRQCMATASGTRARCGINPLCIRASATRILILTRASPLQSATPATLLAQKQELLERLHQDSGPPERDQIERLLAKIDRALNFLDQHGPEQERRA